MLLGTLFLIGGIVLIVWGAERFTDGALGAATRFAVSPFYVGVIVSGFEPENLVTGIAAGVGGLPQVALGTVIGSTVFLLTAALGVALLVVPMAVQIPREGPFAMLLSLLAVAATLGTAATVSRLEGFLLLLGALALLVWLYRRAPAFRRTREGGEVSEGSGAAPSAIKAVGLLIIATIVILLGAELLVSGARTLVSTAGVSETFLGMAVIGLGESLEETARMVAPARRGHPELALGNVVGTVVILLVFNLGVIALIRPLTADPLVVRVHLPYLAGCAVVVSVALLTLRKLGRLPGGLLVMLYVAYLAINVAHMWR
jgi:cation:H+ antiporter